MGARIKMPPRDFNNNYARRSSVCFLHLADPHFGTNASIGARRRDGCAEGAG
jgi:hypothetical protein